MYRISMKTSHDGYPLYRVFVGNKTISYSVYRYGIYAEKLAKLSAQTGKRYNNYYEIFNSYVIIYNDSRKYGDNNIYVSLDDFEKIKDYYWYVVKSRHVLYASNDKVGFMHRYIMNADKNYVIDHINHNGLDNRKSNLKETTISGNNKNARLYNSNKLGIRGIHFDITKGKNGSFSAVVNINKVQKKKSFSINKYGKERALEMAIVWRKEMEDKLGYNGQYIQLFKNKNF